ncbi:unnamed protein product [Paramecium primaurelia]|uniref:Tetratricopeptide repeat protein n=1 Tax=Paramecium primaurelia TaxID=5886 RepID=A0A8S1QI57_PARPR|nr:unnamed protein product [Paramecium primaurelia]
MPYSNRKPKNFEHAILFSEQGQKEKALLDYNTAIKLNPNDAEVYYNRAILFSEQGQKEKALLDYNMAIRLNPNDAEVFINRGNLFYQQGEKEKAIQDYNKALVLQPDQPLCLTNLGILILKANNLIKQKYIQQELKNYQIRLIHKHFNGIQLILILHILRKNLSYLDKFKFRQYLSKGFPIQKTNQLKEQTQIVVNQLLQDIKPIDTQLNKNQQIFNNNIFKIIEQLQIRMATLEINVNSLLQQDNFRVSESLKQLNKNQLMYFNALTWRLLNYLQAMQQISTNLFQINKNATIESKSLQTLNVFQKILNKTHRFQEDYLLLGMLLTQLMLLSILDQNLIKSINLLKDQKNQIIFQNVVLELSKNQSNNLFDKPKSSFRKFADQLLQEEDKQFRDNIYWAAGSEDALIILNYLEVNSDRIVNELLSKNVILRQIIVKAIKEQNESSNKLKVADKGSLRIYQ